VLAVVTASRRTDLPGRYAGWLSECIRAGQAIVPQPYSGRPRLVSLRPSDVHTLVLLSKDFGPLLRDEAGLRAALANLRHVTCQFTVTGLGGSRLEPGVPPAGQALEQLPSLVAWLGDARRLTLRFDPIVHWHEDGRVQSNFAWSGEVLAACAAAGVSKLRISFATIYRKMSRRGVAWVDPPLDEKLGMARDLVAAAARLGIAVHGCCQPDLASVGVQASGCVDAAELSELHPDHLDASTQRAHGQRAACLCSESVDVGSYEQPCPNGCLYCYARPLVHGKST
jgi:hypothetical protein